MTTQTEYIYEVGFSFLKQDEAIAYELNDHIQDRLSTFIYSKKQEELVGTNGERKFNKVFYEECRVVVVLYRDGWGKTPWTRIEETAIKNRAVDNGWNFFFFINLDPSSTVPSWIPKTNLWLDYQRFKTEGAIAVIEYKVKEQGGTSRQETIAEAAERLKRLRKVEKERDLFLKSQEAVTAANRELRTIIEKLKELKPIIEDPETFLDLASSERTNVPMYEFGFNGYYLCFNSVYPIQHDIANGTLKVTIYEKRGHEKTDYKEYIHKQSTLSFDRDLIGNNGWSEYNTGNNFLTTDELIDKWVKQFITDIGKRKKTTANSVQAP
jgi:hypothetical protein